MYLYNTATTDIHRSTWNLNLADLCKMECHCTWRRWRVATEVSSLERSRWHPASWSGCSRSSWRRWPEHSTSLHSTLQAWSVDFNAMRFLQLKVRQTWKVIFSLNTKALFIGSPYFSFAANFICVYCVAYTLEKCSRATVLWSYAIPFKPE